MGMKTDLRMRLGKSVTAGPFHLFRRAYLLTIPKSQITKDEILPILRGSFTNLHLS